MQCLSEDCEREGDKVAIRMKTYNHTQRAEWTVVFACPECQSDTVERWPAF